jgi:hypothetical protein
MAIPTTVIEHMLALLGELCAHRIREVYTFNGNVERRDLLKINDLFSVRLKREVLFF